MTVDTLAAPESAPAARVRAVRQRYARRGDRGTVRGHAYTLYLVALFAAFYLVPVFHARRTSPASVSVGSLTEAAPWVCALAVAVCWTAQIAGRFWGPVVVQPFLLHVFMSTDISPTRYLGTIARRRLTYVGATGLLSACVAAYLATDLFDHLDSAVQGLTSGVGLSALAAFAWLWGQVRPLRDNLLLASALGGTAVVVGGVSRVAPDSGTGLWLLAGVLAATAAVLGRAALRAIRTVDLARLSRESARASQAQTYAWTGTLHHALDLYRPEPSGLTSALIRPDGRLRGYLPQGAVRALRTPGRAGAGAALLLTGSSVLTHGAGGRGDGPASWLWALGALCVYLGSGWVGETWRGLRDELTLAPLYGERWGGTLARTLAWPVVAVTIGAFLGGGFAVVVRWDHHSGHLGDTAILVTGSVVMALGARFLREMKLDLPLELLLPVITPFGDLSGLRFVAWQFDGFVVVLVGVALMAALPSAVGATALAVCMAAGCVWTGLRRTGWAHRGLFSRLSRVQ
ncbi:hypothetical protein OG471_31920 [Streptomyces sp. NBC_01336]|uniref:hypothetical protein n=1 Tax=Streptomyces sp. NBC_01336 TaxID=2903829 RepID=UPI002E0D77AD|nr:hypothetical protein OG471_31920 [Streptomyces sp. NBC_01336]